MRYKRNIHESAKKNFLRLRRSEDTSPTFRGKITKNEVFKYARHVTRNSYGEFDHLETLDDLYTIIDLEYGTKAAKKFAKEIEDAWFETYETEVRLDENEYRPRGRKLYESKKQDYEMSGGFPNIKVTREMVTNHAGYLMHGAGKPGEADIRTLDDLLDTSELFWGKKIARKFRKEIEKVWDEGFADEKLAHMKQAWGLYEKNLYGGYEINPARAYREPDRDADIFVWAEYWSRVNKWNIEDIHDMVENRFGIHALRKHKKDIFKIYRRYN